jgi:Arc/MetJ-type ribon-helix-helix transcriptional regulator
VSKYIEFSKLLYLAVYPSERCIMDVKLPREIETIINDSVEAGKYASVEELLVAAVLQLRDDEPELSEEDLRAIEEAEAEIAAGNFVDFNEFVAEMKRKYGE